MEPARVFPLWRNAKTMSGFASPVGAAARFVAGRHNPVTPMPVGTSRSHTATSGRNFAALLVIVTVAAVSPGDVASTCSVPAVLVDRTIAMQSPAKAFREDP